MNKILKNILSVLFVGFVVLYLYHRYVLNKWYTFKMQNFQIQVMSDECETCFLDWTIHHTVKVISKNGEKGKFTCASEGPKLEFGLNNKKNIMLINSHGSSPTYLNLGNMETIDFWRTEKPNPKDFNIFWIINDKRELIKLDSIKAPDTFW